jgi:1-acyl-sn-glycerol-3-phosphate acyltransferase
LFGYGSARYGQILIDRSDHQAAIDELKRHLGRKGASVVFFPEGHRAESRELLRFKKGGAAFAIDAGLPILPVAISGF